MNVSICIATFGDSRWRDLAYSRAYPSALEQGAHEIIMEHQPEGTVASSRNAAAEKAKGDWLCFLDADDELAQGYLSAMRRVYEREQLPAGSQLLLTPAVQFVRNGKPQRARLMPKVDYQQGNYLIIGTLVPRGLFLEIGGFPDEPRYGAWEDWHFWARCQMAGAKVVQVPRATYIAHMEPDSRHRAVPHEERIRWHYEVGRDLFPELYKEDWLQRHLRGQRRVRA